ncbi:MAG: desulfoferrodoxin [Nanoarchaeota archaeon]|nr:desulfoferrodoxin [Nanoarchaeota archaeon]MBU1974783.1 desulfoferrodoxin [Nanoarchaeota archaeon]
MAEKMGIYKCEICGNVVGVLEAHEGELVCCEKPMVLQEEKTAAQEGKEKHVPVIEKTDSGVKVTVGSVNHPMEDKHYIVIIQLMKGDKMLTCKKLFPGDEPVAEFNVEYSDDLVAREYCNLHGLWKS